MSPFLMCQNNNSVISFFSKITGLGIHIEGNRSLVTSSHLLSYSEPTIIVSVFVEIGNKLRPLLI
jgi:hypothetical protein